MAESILVLGVVLVAAVLVLAVLVYARDRGRFAFREEWRALAQRLGGRMEPGRPRIDFQVSGRRAAAQCERHDAGPRSVIRVDVLGLSPGALRILPDEYSRLYKVLARMEDHEVGDPDFDRDFVLQANPPELAREIFSPDRRLWLITRLRRLAMQGQVRVHLGLDQLEIVVWSELHGDAMFGLVEAASGWVQVLLEMAAARPAFVRTEGGLCRVCGTALGEAVIDCARCRTPHHEECWRYAGGCSTYGCGERRFEEPLRRSAS